MRFFTVFLLYLIPNIVFSQHIFKGVIKDEFSQEGIPNVVVVNRTTYATATSLSNGVFAIEAKEGDELQLIHSNYDRVVVELTKDWLQVQSAEFILRSKAEELEEIYISTLRLTWILEVDSRLIAFAEYPYTKDLSMTPYSQYTGFNPVKSIYRKIKKNSDEYQKIQSIKEEEGMLALMQKRYDRELVSGLTGVSKTKIIEMLQRCDYDERFIYTANDHQIYVALNQCMNKLK